MRLNRVLGLLVAASGVVAASWGPRVFEFVSGQVLPPPAANDPAAMAAWSGVAFLRVLGALLLGFGALLWVASGGMASARRIHVVVLAMSAFAVLILTAQQIAIWTNGTGWFLAGLFAVVATRSALALRDRPMVHGESGTAV